MAEEKARSGKSPRVLATRSGIEVLPVNPVFPLVLGLIEAGIGMGEQTVSR
jgi:hypothetical protein